MNYDQIKIIFDNFLFTSNILINHVKDIILQIAVFVNSIIYPIFSIATFGFNKIVNYSPNPGFISEVAVIEGVVVTIAIPLSCEIIGRLSDRYHSDVITRKFRNKLEIRFLPWFLVFNLFAIIILKFIEGSNTFKMVWVPFAWTILICFVFLGAWLLRFFYLLIMHTDPDYILNELSKDANEALQ